MTTAPPQGDRGKGHRLLALRALGLPVPAFVLVPQGETLDVAAIRRRLGPGPLVVRRSDRGRRVAAVHSMGLADAQLAEAVEVQRGASAAAVVVQVSVDALTAGVLRTDGPGVLFVRQSQHGRPAGGSIWVVRGRIRSVDGGDWLPEATARLLAAIGAEVDAYFGAPQEVDWALHAHGHVTLLDARPLDTTPPAPPELWDAPELMDWVVGGTTPLSHSFAQRMFRRQYEALASRLGVPRSQLDAGTFEGLVGYARGRAFRRVEPWRHLATALPGVHEASLAVLGPVRTVRSGAMARSVRSALSRASLARRLRAATAAFDALHARDSAAHVAAATTEALASACRALEVRLGASVCVATELFASRFAEAARGAVSDLTAEGVDDHGVVPGLVALAARVRQDPDLLDLFRRHDDAGVLRAIMGGSSECAALHEGFAALLERVGGRCAGGLKLESPTLAEDPRPLVAALRRAAEEPEPPTSLARPVAFFNAPRLYWLIRRARRYLDARARAHHVWLTAFGLLRRLTVALGRRFCAGGLLDAEDDVFWLTVPELYGLADGTLVIDKALVAARRGATAPPS